MGERSPVIQPTRNAFFGRGLKRDYEIPHHNSAENLQPGAMLRYTFDLLRHNGLTQYWPTEAYNYCIPAEQIRGLASTEGLRYSNQ